MPTPAKSTRQAARSTLNARKAQTDSLPVLIGNVRSIFRNELDKTVPKKKETALEFHGGYFAARAIVSRPDSRARTATAPPAPAKT
jgi:hypothetical protein